MPLQGATLAQGSQYDTRRFSASARLSVDALDASLWPTPLHLLRASAMRSTVADGGTITTWTNEGSVGGNPTQAVAGQRGVLQYQGLKGFSGVMFDGVDDCYDFNITDIPQPFKAIIVCAPTLLATGASYMPLGFGTGSTRGVGIVNASPTPKWGAYAGGSPNVVLNAPLPTFQPHVLRATINGASSLLVLDETTSQSGDSGSGLSALTRLNIGGASDATPTFGSFFGGLIGMIGIYDGAVSDSPLAALATALFNAYNRY